MFPSVVPVNTVRRLTIYKVGSTTMNVKWEKVEGATAYKLQYIATNATEPSPKREVWFVLQIPYFYSTTVKWDLLNVFFH